MTRVRDYATPARCISVAAARSVYCRTQRPQASPNGAVLCEPRVERREGNERRGTLGRRTIDAKTPKGNAVKHSGDRDFLQRAF